MVTASGDNTARIWDARSGKVLATLEGHSEYVGAASFSPDNTRVVTASSDGTGRIWDVHLEFRDPETIHRLVECKMPLRFEEGALVPTKPDASKCRSVEEPIIAGVVNPK